MSAVTKLLLVEDDQEQAILFAHVLSQAGNEVSTSPTAEDAMTKLTQGVYDVVIIDWDLPGMKGDTMVTILRTEYPLLKTMLYSNHADVESVARHCGADSWFCKSDDIKRLRKRVTNITKTN